MQWLVEVWRSRVLAAINVPTTSSLFLPMTTCMEWRALERSKGNTHLRVPSRWDNLGSKARAHEPLITRGRHRNA
jgi:hypothetical protein